MPLATKDQVLEVQGARNTQGQGEECAGASEGMANIGEGEEDVHSTAKLDEYLSTEAGLQR